RTKNLRIFGVADRREIPRRTLADTGRCRNKLELPCLSILRLHDQCRPLAKIGAISPRDCRRRRFSEGAGAGKARRGADGLEHRLLKLGRSVATARLSEAVRRLQQISGEPIWTSTQALPTEGRRCAGAGSNSLQSGDVRLSDSCWAPPCPGA